MKPKISFFCYLLLTGLLFNCSNPEKQLISNGYQITSKSFQELYLAYLRDRSNDLKSIESFFKLGYNKDSLSGKILDYSRFECYPILFDKPELLKLLFKYNIINKNFKQKETGDNLLHIAIYGLYEALYSRSADDIKLEYIINGIEEWEFQHMVSLEGYNLDFTPKVEIVKYLLKRGVDVNQSNNNNQYPLFLASTKKDERAALLLIEQGADVNSISFSAGHEWTPMIAATAYGNIELVKLLLERGASLSKSVILNPKDGSTYHAYSQAEYNNNTELLALFDNHMKPGIDKYAQEYPLVYNVSEKVCDLWDNGTRSTFCIHTTIEHILKSFQEEDGSALLAYGQECFKANDKDLALSWFNHLIDKGYTKGYFYIRDYFYDDDEGNYINTEELIALMEKAIEAGDKSGIAENTIGTIYYYGNGVEQSFEIAKDYFVKAKEKGNTDAIDNIAICNRQLNRAYNSTSSKSNNSQRNNQIAKDRNIFSVTVENGGFIDVEIPEYVVVIKRTHDLSGNYVDDWEDKITKTSGLFGSNADWFDKEYGYYKVEYYGYDEYGDKVFHKSYENVVHKCHTVARFYTNGYDPYIECF
jgi:hypothetical protein